MVAHLEAVDAGVLGGLFEVLGEELLLLVEVVAGALSPLVSFALIQPSKNKP